MAIAEQAAATSQRETHFHTCPLCEATCGLTLEVEGGTVVRIRGDRDDVFSHGFICPKGATLGALQDDPDRLRTPMIKRDGVHVAVTWDEAFAEIDARLTPLLAEHGRDAVAVYLGNPNVHNHANTIYVRPLIMALGTGNVYSASTVDQMPRHASSGMMFGDGLTIAVPDVDRTDYLLMLGANPWESNGSLCTAPDLPGRLEAIAARGGRMVVVDPRRTKTAQAADEHLAIRPGGDAAWLLALIHVLFDEDLVDLGRLEPLLLGVDDVAAAVLPCSPEAVEAATWIDPATTRRIARELAAASSASVYGRIGVHTAAFGTLASWATDVLVALTANLDEPGGSMFPAPAHSSARTAPGGRGFTIGRRRSRVKGYPEVKGELPVATLADEIQTPGDGQVRALITVAGNPVRSCPDTTRLEAAIAGLELLISIDPYLNETTQHADVILPPPGVLEKSHYDLAFYGLAVRNVANYSPAVLERTGPDEAELLARLALIAGGQGAQAEPQVLHDLVLDGLLARAVAPDGALAGRDVAEIRAALGDRSPADRVLDLMLRTGQYGDRFGGVPDGLSLDRLEAHPHGIDLGALTPQLPNALKTASACIELAPEPIIDDIGRLVAGLGDVADGPVLVGRRHLQSNNSWMHNVRVLVKGKERCTLQVHPDDAAAWSLVDGGSARVTSAVGSVVAPVEVTTDIARHVVSLPHGWGHDAPGARMAVAGARPGVNSNVLTDGSTIDPLSGNAILNAIAVTVEPA